jgi:hypothetical protein
VQGACVAADFSRAGLPETGQDGCYNETAAAACPAAAEPFFGQDAHHAGIPIGLRPLGADEVLEPVTGVIWRRRHDGIARSRDDAAAHCASLGAGFRLPSLFEAVAALDYGRAAPAIDETLFPHTAGRTFWTGDRGVSNEAWVYTAFGLSERRADSAFYPARCVRPAN